MFVPLNLPIYQYLSIYLSIYQSIYPVYLSCLSILSICLSLYHLGPKPSHCEQNTSERAKAKELEREEEQKKTAAAVIAEQKAKAAEKQRRAEEEAKKKAKELRERSKNRLRSEAMEMSLPGRISAVKGKTVIRTSGESKC